MLKHFPFSLLLRKNDPLNLRPCSKYVLWEIMLFAYLLRLPGNNPETKSEIFKVESVSLNKVHKVNSLSLN